MITISYFFMSIYNKISDSVSFSDAYYFVFDKHLGYGKVFCPFHPNEHTPAAKVYDNKLYCFVCRRLYSSYDLLKKFAPQKLNELMRTSVLSNPSKTVLDRKRYKIVPKQSTPIETLNLILNGD